MTVQVSGALAGMIDRGVRLRLDGDDLKVTAPAGTLTTGARTSLRVLKPTLVSRLRALRTEYDALLARATKGERYIRGADADEGRRCLPAFEAVLEGIAAVTRAGLELGCALQGEFDE